MAYHWHVLLPNINVRRFQCDYYANQLQSEIAHISTDAGFNQDNECDGAGVVQ